MEKNPEDEDKFTGLRRKIKEIQSDNSLSPQEKAQKIQRLMSGKPIEEEKPKPVPMELDKTPTYHKEGIFGCKHYQRNCKILSDCCKQLITCRFCHDEKITDHQIDRYAIKQMMCMFCQYLQPIQQTCANPECRKEMGRYYCDVCKFVDNTPNKLIFHCNECGLCRVGKIDEFFHCNGCNMCLNINIQNNHKCIPNNMKSNCPICHIDMFTSRKPSVLLKCGHSIHSSCLSSYSRRSFTCPICSKSIGDMSHEWEIWDQMIQQQPMPPEFNASKCEILCNDCNQKCEVPFHFLGHKCSHCGSYNTVVQSRKNFPQNPNNNQEEHKN